MYATIGTQLFAGLSPHYFGDLSRSFFTLLQAASGDAWASVLARSASHTTAPRLPRPRLPPLPPDVLDCRGAERGAAVAGAACLCWWRASRRCRALATNTTPRWCWGVRTSHAPARCNRRDLNMSLLLEGSEHDIDSLHKAPLDWR